MFRVVLVTAFCSLVVCAPLTFPTGSARLFYSVPDACVSACKKAMLFRRDVVPPRWRDQWPLPPPVTYENTHSRFIRSVSRHGNTIVFINQKLRILKLLYPHTNAYNKTLLWRYCSTGRQLCFQCAVTDENQIFGTDLGSRLSYLSVIFSGNFLNQGSHSTCTIIQRNILLHNFFSQCRPVRDCAIMMSSASVDATVENTISLLPMICETALLYYWSTLRKFCVDEWYAVWLW